MLVKYKIGRLTESSLVNILKNNIKIQTQEFEHWKYVVVFENKTMLVLGEKILEDIMDHFIVPGILINNYQIKDPAFVDMPEEEEAKVVLAYSPVADLLFRMYERNGSC